MGGWSRHESSTTAKKHWLTPLHSFGALCPKFGFRNKVSLSALLPPIPHDLRNKCGQENMGGWRWAGHSSLGNIKPDWFWSFDWIWLSGSQKTQVGKHARNQGGNCVVMWKGGIWVSVRSMMWEIRVHGFTEHKEMCIPAVWGGLGSYEGI